jgi:hypothetical protein
MSVGVGCSFEEQFLHVIAPCVRRFAAGTISVSRSGGRDHDLGGRRGPDRGRSGARGGAGRWTALGTAGQVTVADLTSQGKAPLPHAFVRPRAGYEPVDVVCALNPPVRRTGGRH